MTRVTEAIARAPNDEPTHSAPAPLRAEGFPELTDIEFTGFNPKFAATLVVMPEIAASAVEQYRKLAAALHLSHTDRGLKVIMISSAVPGEGKTMTAANLALTLSESYRKDVLLIDSDLRRPALFDVFQLPNIAGLSEWLKAHGQKSASIVRISRHLAFLPAGRPDSDPMSGLTSDRMRRLLTEAAATYDWVVIDTPPVGLLSDANLLAEMVDAALLVIRAGVTPYRLIQHAVEALGERLIGVVFNCTDEGLAARRYGYAAYAGYASAVRLPK